MYKEKYYSKENQLTKSKEWEIICRQIRKRTKYEFYPERASLLVLDMQNFFLLSDSHAFVPSGPEIIKNVQNLIEFFQMHQSPIFFTQHISSKSEKDLMIKWWNDSISVGEKKSQIIEVLSIEGAQIIQKHQYSAFYRTKLHGLLQNKEITQVVITGVLSHLCCETSARDAFMHGYQVIFPYDSTATYSESLHRGTIQAISHGFGECCSTNSLLDINN